MTYHPDIHHRQSIRLRGRDYTQAGCYFITICSAQKLPLFGTVVDGVMILNDFGYTVQSAWEWLSEQYDYVMPDTYVVMPNHFHGIIIIRNVHSEAGVPGHKIPGHERLPGRSPRLGDIIGYFKYQTAKQINADRRGPIIKVWQRNYYDHVIRDLKSQYYIEQYIKNNPIEWQINSENHLDREIQEIESWWKKRSDENAFL